MKNSFLIQREKVCVRVGVYVFIFNLILFLRLHLFERARALVGGRGRRRSTLPAEQEA